MKSNSRRALQLILASVLLLMGCDVSTFILPEQIPTSNPNVVHLMVVQTAAAAATETAGFIPPILTSTLTPFPTQTPVNSPTVTPTFIFLLATSTSASSGAACDDAAIFVSDLTIPDNTVENPGQSFVKTWVLQNTGSCTWGGGYTLNFVSGTQMGGRNTSVGSSVAPGEQAQISVTMTAPTTAGEYTGAWRLNNASGESFGETVDVVIDVNANEYTQTPAYTATATPINSTAATVTSTNTSPAPTNTPPASTNTSPAPTNTPPASTNTSPAPTSTHPAPTNTPSVPTSTSPAPTNTHPAPTNTSPAPTNTP